MMGTCPVQLGWVIWQSERFVTCFSMSIGHSDPTSRTLFTEKFPWGPCVVNFSAESPWLAAPQTTPDNVCLMTLLHKEHVVLYNISYTLTTNFCACL